MHTQLRGVEREPNLSGRNELISLVSRHCPQDGVIELAPGVVVYRSSAPFGPLYRASDASFCLIAQGAKEVMLGKERYRYGPSQYLLATAGLPLVSHITDATADRPFLGMKVVLDQALVASVVVEADHVAAGTNGPVRPVTITTLTPALLDATIRLLRLADTPRDYKVLGPLVVREIVYRLLLTGQRGRLCQIASLGTAELRMAKAIQMIRKDYNKPLYIARLSASLAMSPSGFHHHFKAATAMSPLQFQKQIRLQEARRLLVSGQYDAATAAYQVGYEEPSQFTREYKRQFGEPPMRDVEQMRAAVGTRASRGA